MRLFSAKREEFMNDTPCSETPVKPKRQPVQVLQFADGYLAVFSKTFFEISSGESPHSKDLERGGGEAEM
jgi:hypothetical protein